MENIAEKIELSISKTIFIYRINPLEKLAKPGVAVELKVVRSCAPARISEDWCPQMFRNRV
jgi:hypothetical protein